MEESEKRLIRGLNRWWSDAQKLTNGEGDVPQLTSMDDVRKHRPHIERTMEQAIRDAQMMVEEWERQLYDMSRELDRPTTRAFHEEDTAPYRMR